MPYVLKDLKIDRVDLVDEGANSAAYIELYKRKESNKPMDFNEILEKMKPEHAEVVSKAFTDKDAELAKAREDLAGKEAELNVANEALAKAKAELETLNESVSKSAAESEEEILKAMPEQARAAFLTMRAQKEAAEEQVRKSAAEKLEAEAVAKAATLKSLPIEQPKLVEIIKGCTPEVLGILEAANSAVEAAVLGEVGKNRGNGAGTEDTDAWADIEKKAAEIAKRDSVTIEKAIGVAVAENPDLYKRYIEGGKK